MRALLKHVIVLTKLMDVFIQTYEKSAELQAAAEAAAKVAEAQADAEEKAKSLRQHAMMLMHISRLAQIRQPVPNDFETFTTEALCEYIRSIWMNWERELYPMTSVVTEHPRDSTMDEVREISLYLSGKLAEEKKRDFAEDDALFKKLHNIIELHEKREMVARQQLRRQENMTKMLVEENTQFRATILELEGKLDKSRGVSVENAGRRHGAPGLHASGASNKTLHF